MKEDRNTTKKDTKLTVADKEEHPTGRDNISPQSPLNAENAGRGDITKRYAVSKRIQHVGKTA